MSKLKSIQLKMIKNRDGIKAGSVFSASMINGKPTAYVNGALFRSRWIELAINEGYAKVTKVTYYG